MPKTEIKSIFDVLKVIGQREKGIVLGFIRQQQKNSCPELIIVACVWFYFQMQKRCYPSIDWEKIRHYYIPVEKEDYKLATLADLYEMLPITQATVYCNTRRKVEW